MQCKSKNNAQEKRKLNDVPLILHIDTYRLEQSYTLNHPQSLELRNMHLNK